MAPVAQVRLVIDSHRQINPPVVVEVGGSGVQRSMSGHQPVRQRERAIPMVDKHDELVRLERGRGEVRCAVAVEIRKEDIGKVSTGRVAGGWVEGAVTPPQKNRETGQSADASI